MVSQQYETDRLILRNWKDSDKEPFSLINSDPVVMEFFYRLLTREQSDNMIQLITERIVEDRFGFWAVERKDTGQFIGFVGINRFTAELPFCPCVEIGWRLAHGHWGQGFATEAALKSLDVGFNQHSLDEIVAFTTVKNKASRRVMEKIGMVDTKQNFFHPSVPADSHLQEHCLYKITRN